MQGVSARVERIVTLVSELTPDERVMLAERIEALEGASGRGPDPERRARVANAIRRVVRDHPDVLTALAK
jgi:hypothetical protein